MDVNQLREILSQNEGLKLDFKREYKLIRVPTPDTDPATWRRLVDGQWHEMVKDIIALANGNVGVPDKVGYLIIGADDQLQQDGTRATIDVAYLGLNSQQILKKVNSISEPPIPDIVCEQILIDGHHICVISIPPTPYVHETNQPLITISGNFDGAGKLASLNSPKTYTEYTAFIRKGENISPASANERRALEIDKRFDLLVLEENLKFELINNLKKMLEKIEGNALREPAMFYRRFRDAYTLTVEDMTITGNDITWLILALTSTGSAKTMSTRFIDMAINSSRYLVYNPQTGRHERSKFLIRLQELSVNIEKFKGAYDFPGNTKFLAKFGWNRPRDNERVRVSAEEIISIAATLERFEDVAQLSSALLAYLLGDKESLNNIQLNAGSPVETENEGIAAETPTDNEITEWVLSHQWIPTPRGRENQ